MRSRLASPALGLLVVALLVAGRSAAEEPVAPVAAAASPVMTVEGRIVGNEEGELVVDLGAKAGVVPGTLVELWRPVTLRHPVTGRAVTDRYRIGTLRIDEVLEVVSFARVEGEVRHPTATGDIVVARVRKPTAAPAAATPPTKVALPETAPGAATETPRATATAPAATAGAPAAACPPCAEAAATSVPPGTTASVEEPSVARFQPPRSVLSGASLDLGIEIAGAARGALLHSRNASEVSYVTVPMRGAGDRFWVATLEADRVRAPAVEYFIEAVRPDGTATSLVGDPNDPMRVRVADPPSPAPPLRHRSSAVAYTDYADYNWSKGNDIVWQTEGSFGMRFADRGVRALRSGFGVYRGLGGSLEELDVLKLPPRRVGLTYGHLEGEAAFSPTTSIIARVTVGLRDDGVSGGGQLHVRIGSDLDTNLTIGGEVLGGIGLRGIAQLELAPTGRVPIAFRTEVTNQPAGVAVEDGSLSRGTNDVGGRVIVQGGYRFGSSFVAFGRLSYQGRTIVHAGPGFGAGASYEW